MIAFGFNPRGTDETWCIDTRGVLTLSVDAGTYQRLGLLGTPLPWRPHQHRYSMWTPLVSSLPDPVECVYLSCAIAVVLSQKVPTGAKHWNPLGPKQISALELYDNLREKAGFDAWDIVYHSGGDGTSEVLERSMPGRRLTFARPTTRSIRPVELGADPTTQGHSHQHAHSGCQPITAIEH